MKIPYLQNFLSSKESAGCDLGATHLKLIRLKKKNGGFELISLGIFEIDVNNPISIQRTRAYLNENGFGGSLVGLNIDHESLRIRRLDLPEMPDGDLKIAIKWNLREYVEIPIEKYAVSYSKITKGSSEEGKMPVIAYGVASEAVDALVKLAKQFDLKAGTVEPNATALLSAFDLNVQWSPGKIYILIDIGSHTTNFVVMRDGVLLFSRLLSGMNLENLFKAVPEESKAILKNYMGGKPGPMENIEFAISTFLSQMVLEIQRSIDAFCIMYRVDKADAIYLTGGGAMIPDICTHLSKNLGVETKVFNPFEKIDTNLVKGDISNPQLYAVAVGLALPRA